MGDTSETNTKVLSRELILGVVALKRLYRKIIICATRTLFPGTVTYWYVSFQTQRLIPFMVAQALAVDVQNMQVKLDKSLNAHIDTERYSSN